MAYGSLKQRLSRFLLLFMSLLWISGIVYAYQISPSALQANDLDEEETPQSVLQKYQTELSDVHQSYKRTIASYYEVVQNEYIPQLDSTYNAHYSYMQSMYNNYDGVTQTFSAYSSDMYNECVLGKQELLNIYNDAQSRQATISTNESALQSVQRYQTELSDVYTTYKQEIESLSENAQNIYLPQMLEKYNSWNNQIQSLIDNYYESLTLSDYVNQAANYCSQGKAELKAIRDDAIANNPREPYAVLDGTTLYFYYDDQKTARNGMSVGPFTVTWNDGGACTVTGREWENTIPSITTAVFDESFGNCTTVTSTAGWFCNDSNLVAIRGIEHLKTENVTDMRSMFYGCSKLTSLDVSNFNTANATNLRCMFDFCSSLTSLDVNKFKTANVTDMSRMFDSCQSLMSLDVSNFNTANVTNMSGMFDQCNQLVSLDVSNFNTANVTDMSFMFTLCKRLTSLDVSNFNTANVTDMSRMFAYCSSLTSLDVSNFNTVNVTDMAYMFSHCYSLTSLNVSRFKTGNVTDMSRMFDGCEVLNTIYAGDGWSTVNVTEGAEMFSECTNLVGGAGTTYDANHIDHAYARIDGGPNSQTPGYFTAKRTAGGLEIYAIEKGATVTPNQPITATQSIIVTPGNDSEWLTDMSMGSAWENPLEFTASIYYPNSSATHTFVNSMRGTNNPKDGELTDGVSSGNGYKHTQKNLPQSGGFLVFEALQNGSLIVPVRVFANKQFYVVDANGKTKTDIQFKDADGNTLSLMTDPLCAVSTEEITGFVSFNVVQGEKYYIFCTGSKVRFGGYVFSPESITIDPATMANVKSILDAEPYVVLDGTTLTFYYDDQKEARGGMDVGPFTVPGDRRWESAAASVTTVKFDESMANCTSLTSTAYWFYGFQTLTTVTGIENLKTDNVTDMQYMFHDCNVLTSIDVTGFNTTNVTNMRGMFYKCQQLQSIDLSSFNTALVTDMSWMFYGCNALTKIYAGSEWTAEGVVTDEDNAMFMNCTKLVGGAGTTYDETHADHTYAHIDGGVDNPGYLTELIRKTLTADDYFEWNGMGADATKKSETPSRLCNYYIGQSAEVPYGDPNVSAYAYADLSAYDRLEITATAGTPRILLNRDAEDGYWNADESQSHQIESTQSGWSSKYFSHSGNVWTVDLKQMVADKGFAHLNAIKGDNWSAVTITKMELVKGIVENTSAEPYAVLSDNNTVLTFCYDNQKAANNGADVGPFDYYSKEKRGWSPYTSQITKVVFDQSFDQCTSLTSTAFWFTFMDKLETIENIQYLHTDNVENMDCMFDSCYVLRDLDVSHFVTSKVKNMQCMFNRCELLTSLDLRNFDTSSCEFMRGMFYDCKGLTSLNITSFDTSKNTSTESMFQFCSSLTTLDLSHFSTESVTDMSYMFGNCEKLTSLDLSSFNTSRVTEMECMFNQCTSLTNINFGQNFNTENVTKMSLMFSGCTGLTSLDVSRFNTQNVTEMTAMFQRCSGLTDLDLSSFNTERVSMMGWVFNYCSSLRSLNISGFSTANVTDIVNMFKECSSLASIQAGNAAIPDSIYAQIGNPNLLLYVNEASLAPSNVQNVVVNGAAENIVLTDAEGNNNFYCPLEFTARRISYTHNYKQATEIGVSRGWETIALPFDVQTITHEKNGPLAPFGVDGGKPFWLRQLTDNGLISAQRIEANMPYLISMPNNGRYPADYNQAGNVTFSATNVVVPMTEQREMSGNNRMLIPTTMRVAQSPSVYAINRNASYENNPEGSIFVADYREVRPFEAYVEHPNGARFFTLGDLAEGDVTDIQAIRDIASSDVVKVYNLSGVLLKTGKRQEVMSQLPKGIYIVNGVKVVVK